MSHVNPCSLAVLALLVERPMHPYEMYQLLIDRSEDRLLKVRPGTLYHAVGRLAETGFVRPTGTEREGNRPERTTYELTASGRDQLLNQVRSMLATPQPEYPAFPLALAESHNLPRADVIDLLSTRIQLLTVELNEIDESIVAARRRGVAVRYWVDATYQRASRSTELSWLTAFVADLTSGAITWDDVGDDATEPPSLTLSHHESAGPAT